MEQEQTSGKKLTAGEMLQKLDSHYEKEEQLADEISKRVQWLKEIRDEIQLMQTMIMFQMKKEFKKKE